MDSDDEPDIREQMFHNTVRENIIFLLFFLALYLLSILVIRYYFKKDRSIHLDNEDIVAHRVAIWICSFSVAISLGASLLLPISIISNEILLLYPKSYYVQWLNSSLIQGLWNIIFLFTNINIFLLLPFAYFFTEAEGFERHKKGIKTRIYETCTVLALLATLLMGIIYLIFSFLHEEKYIFYRIFNLSDFYLPFLYSCMSFLGVLFLLICTPVGCAKLFSVVGDIMVKSYPRLTPDDYFKRKLELEALQHRLSCTSSFKLPAPLTPTWLNRTKLSPSELQDECKEYEQSMKRLEKKSWISLMQRYMSHPGVMLILLVLTGMATLMVMNNTLLLLVGVKALPVTSKQLNLGITSLSSLGPIGAVIEVILILYLILTSVIGFYSLPFVSSIRPKPHHTPMTHLLANCTILLLLSSAVPLLSRTLGISNFDLLGEYGRIEWLGNFYLVLTANLVFVAALVLCLCYKFTDPMKRELMHCLKTGWNFLTTACNKAGLLRAPSNVEDLDDHKTD